MDSWVTNTNPVDILLHIKNWAILLGEVGFTAQTVKNYTETSYTYCCHLNIGMANGAQIWQSAWLQIKLALQKNTVVQAPIMTVQQFIQLTAPSKLVVLLQYLGSLRLHSLRGALHLTSFSDDGLCFEIANLKATPTLLGHSRYIFCNCYQNSTSDVVSTFCFMHQMQRSIEQNLVRSVSQLLSKKALQAFEADLLRVGLAGHSAHRSAATYCHLAIQGGMPLLPHVVNAYNGWNSTSFAMMDYYSKGSDAYDINSLVPMFGALNRAKIAFTHQNELCFDLVPTESQFSPLKDAQVVPK
jgi:hypothetical protein